MSILEPFSETTKQDHYILFITSCYSKLTHAMPTSKTTSTHSAKLFFDHWILRNRIVECLLTDNGVQLASNLFSPICTFLRIKHLKTVPSYLQTNSQAKRYNKSFAPASDTTSRNITRTGKTFSNLSYAYILMFTKTQSKHRTDSYLANICSEPRS